MNTVQEPVRQIILTGGCFQNRLLTEGVVTGLRKFGIEVYTHHGVPANDGSVALGQIAWAARVLSRREE